MITRFLPATLAVLLSFTALAAPPDSRKVFPHPIRTTVLENGLTVVSIPFDSPGIVSYYTVVRAGSRNEVEPGLSGFAHFFEHMMFRGTERYSKAAYNDVLKSIGADNNAFTTDDYTAYHTLASAAALETIMDVEADRFMNLKYSVEDFKTEAGAILGEYNKNYSSPFMTILEKMRDAAYTSHTYKHTTMGFLRDIMDMPNQYEYSLKFFDRWYRPEHCALLVVGDVEHERLTALARKYYGAWKRGTFTLEVPAEPRQSAEKSVELPWKAQTLPVLALGYHGPAFSDREIDMPAMDVLSQVVFSPTSELFRKLVVEEQLVEFIQGGQQDSRDPGLFTVLTRIKDPSRIAEVRKEIDAAIERARTTPVPASRLAEVKSYQKYSYLMGLDNADAIARSICHYIAMTGDPEAVNRVYALYDRVTAEDVRRAAETYLAPANRTVVLLTHEGARQ
jgi:zinc protease